MGQTYLDETPSKHKITLTNGERTVYFPLPDGFGFTVGSEYGTPFDMGSMSSMLQKFDLFRRYGDTISRGIAAGGVSQKMAITMKKGFINPQPTEISFEGELTAYYSAVNEVVVPIINLMGMTLGSNVKGEDVDAVIRKAEEYLNKLVDVTANTSTGADLLGDNTQVSATSTESYQAGIGYAGRLLEFIKVLRGPPQCSIQFGDTYIMPEVFISSVGVKFSNKLDHNGFPLSASVSITCVLVNPPIAEDVIGYFDRSTF